MKSSKTLMVLFALAVFGYAMNRRPAQGTPRRFQHLQGWQKLLGLIALLAAFLMLLNPEFLALGLVGDAAFFDVLVLLLSVQLHALCGRAWDYARRVFSTVARFLMLRLAFSAAAIAVAVAPIGNAMSAIRKALQNTSVC